MMLDGNGDEVIGMIVVNDAEKETAMVVSENGYGKRSAISDYRKTNRGGKGVKTMAITDKTGKLVALKNVTDENDLMIINKSGIVIRMAVADVRVMGRATQGVRLINLSKKNDVIASVCKVMSSELEATVEAESHQKMTQSEAQFAEATNSMASHDSPADDSNAEIMSQQEADTNGEPDSYGDNTDGQPLDFEK